MNNSKGSVLVVTSEFPPMPGGIGNHAYNLSVYLSNRGYAVSVLTNKRMENEEQFNAFISANPSLSISAVGRSSNPIWTYFQRVKTYRQLLSKRPNHIFFSGKFSIWLAALGWHKGKGWGVIHGSEIKQSGVKKTWFERGLLSLHGLISVSGFTQDFLLQSYPVVAEKKCVVINNGFDLQEFPSNPKNVEKGECQIITVGGMHRRKGQHNVIAALPEIIKQFPKVVYTIAGLPETMLELKILAQSFGVESYVQFVPNPSREELVRLLQKAHVFAMLSENLPNGDIEGFGIAILEGMSLGLPAIGSKNSGISDAVNHNVSGMLIDDIHDSTEIVQALIRIMYNYNNFSNQATLWSARFRWSSVIQQYINVLEA